MDGTCRDIDLGNELLADCDRSIAVAPVIAAQVIEGRLATSGALDATVTG